MKKPFAAGVTSGTRGPQPASQPQVKAERVEMIGTGRIMSWLISTWNRESILPKGKTRYQAEVVYSNKDDLFFWWKRLVDVSRRPGREVERFLGIPGIPLVPSGFSPNFSPIDWEDRAESMHPFPLLRSLVWLSRILSV